MLAVLVKVWLQTDYPWKHAKKMEAKQIEYLRRHPKKMEAKEIERNPEIQKSSARFEKEKHVKLQAMADAKQLKQQKVWDQSE